MREILFRGKRKNDGRWVQGLYLVIQSPFTEDGNPKRYLICNGTNAFNDEVIPETVGQYTGLTDNNGKKIFEGDIVCHEKGYNDSHREIGKVFWEEEVCQWRRTSNGSFHHGKITTYRMGSKCVYEIIGNIHDNPELIGGAI